MIVKQLKLISMKSNIHLHTVLSVILILAAVCAFAQCKKQTEKAENLPGFIISKTLYDSLSTETQEKITSLAQQINQGADPSFESVSGIFPKMKYAPALVGVKEHMGKFLVTWDGSLICEPNHVSFNVGEGIPFGRVEKGNVDYSLPSASDKEENVNRSLLDGYLPAITTSYLYDGIVYKETVFAYSKDFSTENPQVAYIRMKVKNTSDKKKNAKLTVCFQEIKGHKDIACTGHLTFKDGGIWNDKGQIIFWGKYPGGQFDNDKLSYYLPLGPGEEKELHFSLPHLPVASNNKGILSKISFDEGLKQTRNYWTKVFAGGMQVNVPEEIVTNAFKTWQIYNFLLAEEDKSKQYYEVHDAPLIYETVYGFAAAMWLNTLTNSGYFEEAKKCVDMFIKVRQPNGCFSGKQFFVPHQNGAIIYAICQLYRTCKDDHWFKKVLPYVLDACNVVINDRTKNKVLVGGEKPVNYGLLSGYQYCEDGVGKNTVTQEFLANSWTWAGLNQAAIALAEFGGEYKLESDRLTKETVEYRNDILADMEKAMIKENELAFLPIVVTNKKPFKSLRESILADYYNILSPRMLESGIFDIDDEKIHWIPDFLEQRDGVVLGMARWKDWKTITPHFGGIDPHFIAGYALTNLRLDETAKFLLTFYGLLSYGMSQETFATQECSSIVTGTSDYFGLGESHWSASRQPHLHSSTEMIRLLRNMLLKEEGDEVWIAYGTPRKWLEDGKKIEVSKAQTCIGRFDFCITSNASKGFITTELTVSLEKSSSVVKLKLRHPEGKKISKVTIDGKEWKDFDGEVILIYPSGENKMSIVATY